MQEQTFTPRSSSRLMELDLHLTGLRDQRDELRLKGRPNQFHKEERASWDEKVSGLAKTIEDATERRNEALASASPEEKQQFRESLQERELRVADEEAKRLGKEELPSQRMTTAQAKEEHFQAVKQEASQAWVPQSVSDWRAQRSSQGQSQNQHQSQGRGQWEAFMDAEKQESAERQRAREAERQSYGQSR